MLCDGQSPNLACVAKASHIYGSKIVDQLIKPDIDPELRKWMLRNLNQELDFGVMVGSPSRVCERLSEMLTTSILRHFAR